MLHATSPNFTGGLDFEVNVGRNLWHAFSYEVFPILMNKSVRNSSVILGSKVSAQCIGGVMIHVNSDRVTHVFERLASWSTVAMLVFLLVFLNQDAWGLSGGNLDLEEEADGTEHVLESDFDDPAFPEPAAKTPRSRGMPVSSEVSDSEQRKVRQEFETQVRQRRLFVLSNQVGSLEEIDTLSDISEEEKDFLRRRYHILHTMD